MGRTSENWIQTFTGRQFWPLNARSEDICIRDIAHALSQKCRWAGHTHGFYSVAQHCVIASLNCPDDPQWALMHDAAEAYLPDVSAPIKPEIKDFDLIEERLLKVIAPKFGLSVPYPASVHRIDIQMRSTERRDLMTKPPASIRSSDNVVPLPGVIDPWASKFAESLFLIRFVELFHTSSKTYLDVLRMIERYSFRENPRSHCHCDFCRIGINGG